MRSRKNVELKNIYIAKQNIVDCISNNDNNKSDNKQTSSNNNNNKHSNIVNNETDGCDLQ